MCVPRQHHVIKYYWIELCQCFFNCVLIFIVESIRHHLWPLFLMRFGSLRMLDTGMTQERLSECSPKKWGKIFMSRCFDFVLDQIIPDFLTSMSYFCLASFLSRKIGMHGKKKPRKQQKHPLLSKAFAFRQIKQGWQTAPQQPFRQKTFLKRFFFVIFLFAENMYSHVSLSSKHPNNSCFHELGILCFPPPAGHMFVCIATTGKYRHC